MLKILVTSVIVMLIVASSASGQWVKELKGGAASKTATKQFIPMPGPTSY